MEKKIKIKNVGKLYVRYVFMRYTDASRLEELLYELYMISDQGVIEHARTRTKELMSRMNISHGNLRQLLMKLEQMEFIKKYKGNILMHPMLRKEQGQVIDRVTIVEAKELDRHKDGTTNLK